jgi:hypothetical protein
MSVESLTPDHNEHWELPVEESVRRAYVLPPYEEARIDELTEEEEAAFVAALAE